MLPMKRKGLWLHRALMIIKEKITKIRDCIEQMANYNFLNLIIVRLILKITDNSENIFDIVRLFLFGYN